MTLNLALPVTDSRRETRDRLEILTALVNGPGFDSLFRDDIIDIPPDHPDYGWGCRAKHCQRPSTPLKDLCHRQGLLTGARGHPGKSRSRLSECLFRRWRGGVLCASAPLGPP